MAGNFVPPTPESMLGTAENNWRCVYTREACVDGRNVMTEVNKKLTAENGIVNTPVNFARGATGNWTGTIDGIEKKHIATHRPILNQTVDLNNVYDGICGWSVIDTLNGTRNIANSPWQLIGVSAAILFEQYGTGDRVMQRLTPIVGVTGVYTRTAWSNDGGKSFSFTNWVKLGV